MKVRHRQLSNVSVHRLAVTKDGVVRFAYSSPTPVSLKNGDNVVNIPYIRREVHDERPMPVETKSESGKHRSFHALSHAGAENFSWRHAGITRELKVNFQGI